MLIINKNLNIDETDEEFIINLYNDYYCIVKKKISFMLFDEMKNNIEDIIQDIFINLIKHIPKLRTLDNNQKVSYIVRTARNTTLNYIKKYVNDKPKYNLGCKDDITAQLIATERDQNPEESIIYVEDISELSKAISTLTPLDQQLLYYYYIGNFSYKEIGKIVCLNENTTRQRVFQAKRRAQKAIEAKRKGVEKIAK